MDEDSGTCGLRRPSPPDPVAIDSTCRESNPIGNLKDILVKKQHCFNIQLLNDFKVYTKNILEFAISTKRPIGHEVDIANYCKIILIRLLKQIKTR